jgi:hypothetical protein
MIINSWVVEKRVGLLATVFIFYVLCEEAIGSLKNIFLKCGSNAEHQLSRSRSSIVNDNQILCDVSLLLFL